MLLCIQETIKSTLISTDYWSPNCPSISLVSVTTVSPILQPVETKFDTRFETHNLSNTFIFFKVPQSKYNFYSQILLFPNPPAHVAFGAIVIVANLWLCYQYAKNRALVHFPANIEPPTIFSKLKHCVGWRYEH